MNEIAYIPIDRRLALARGESLPERTHGAALLADISGLTPLADALVQALGPQCAAEWGFYFPARLGARLSPLNGRFPIAIRREALLEAEALTAERVQLK